MVLKWSFEVSAAESIRQVTPLVLDGVMYFNARSKLYAINAATGTQIWTAHVEPAFPGRGRGPTYGGGRIYAYGRGVMFAVDAKTGAVVESFSPRTRLLYVTGKNAAVALKVKPLGDTLRQGVGAIGFTENIAEGPFRDKQVAVTEN